MLEVRSGESRVSQAGTARDMLRGEDPGLFELAGVGAVTGWAGLGASEPRPLRLQPKVPPPTQGIPAWDISPCTHRSLAPTGTSAVTTGSELSSQVSSPASSAWTISRVSSGWGGPRPPCPSSQMLSCGTRVEGTVRPSWSRGLTPRIHSQTSPECGATLCRLQPPTTPSLPWCSSRRFKETGSTSRPLSTVGPHSRPWAPALGHPAGGEARPHPTSMVLSSASPTLRAWEARERSVSEALHEEGV